METGKKLLPVLVVLWTVAKTGALSSLLIVAVTRSCFKLLLFLGQLPLRTFRLIPLGSFTAGRLAKRGRGRPRSRPLSQYLAYRLTPYTRLFKKVLPRPARVGLLTAGALGVLLFYSFTLASIAAELPSPQRLSQLNNNLTTTFYDRHGQVLYRLFEDKNRSLVELDDIPPYLQQATIAIEDKNFYSHSGFDPEGIVRAGLALIQHRGLQGGSTITQQLIKNTLLTPERTWSRKLKEVILAFWAERIFSKRDLLKMYFNEIPYGGTAWGIAAASQTYFGKQPKDLNLAESAYLAGLPASPSLYSPYGTSPELGRKRQKEVLQRMVEDRYISPEQARQAVAELLKILPPVTEIKAPHFVMYVKKLLEDRYGQRLVDQGGLQVYTSLDLDIQQMAERVLDQEINKLVNLDVGNGAAMVTDPKTGQILTMVGSKNYWDPSGGNFNVALALRQPGSSIKPITYSTAFKMGYLPGSTILDGPVAYKSPWQIYAPVNYDGNFHGLVTLRTALGSSYNVPAVKLLNMVGIANMLQTAHDMGITSLTDTNRYGLSLTLGGGEVKLTDMMTVYGTLSQLGIKHDPQPVLKVTDPMGKVLEDNTAEDSGKRVLPAAVAYLVTDILRDNNARAPAFGPDSLLVIPNHTVAVKTGTTDDKRDNWTLGYTPDLVVGVWVGNNDNHPMNPTLTSGITGAAPIWHRIIANLLKDRPDLAFERPAEVVSGIVEGRKDLVIAGQANKALVEIHSQDRAAGHASGAKDTISFTNPLTTTINDLPSNP